MFAAQNPFQKSTDHVKTLLKLKYFLIQCVWSK